MGLPLVTAFTCKNDNKCCMYINVVIDNIMYYDMKKIYYMQWEMCTNVSSVKYIYMYKAKTPQKILLLKVFTSVCGCVGDFALALSHLYI